MSTFPGNHEPLGDAREFDQYQMSLSHMNDGFQVINDGMGTNIVDDNGNPIPAPVHMPMPSEPPGPQPSVSFIDEKTDDNDGEQNDDESQRQSHGRRKISIEYIRNKNRRHITFSKRKSGIMKKPIVNEPAGRALIQTCLRCDLDCVLNVMTSATEDGMDQNDFGAMASMLYNSVASRAPGGRQLLGVNDSVIDNPNQIVPQNVSGDQRQAAPWQQAPASDTMVAVKPDERALLQKQYESTARATKTKPNTKANPQPDPDSTKRRCVTIIHDETNEVATSTPMPYCNNPDGYVEK